MFFDEPPVDYRYVLAHADAYKTARRTHVYLDSDTGELPWHLVTDVEPGRQRLHMPVTYRFTALDAASGIEFAWFIDTELDDANGCGYYLIDEAALRRVLALLPEAPRAQFRACLANCAEKVQHQWREYQRIAELQKRDADVLHRLATEV